LPVKSEEGDNGTYYKANVKRKAIKKDGERNTAPDVLDGNKQKIESGSIGNGSVGNVMLFQYPYDVAGRKGVASILSKVQVTDLKVYVPDSSTDFEIIESDSKEEATADF